MHQNAQKVAPSTSCTASPAKKSDKNWDLEKALAFIEGHKAAPETKKKSMKKNKKLAEESGDDTSIVRSNSDLLKDGCKQNSEAGGEVRSPCGSSKCFESENLRSTPSVLRHPPRCRPSSRLDHSAKESTTVSSKQQNAVSAALAAGVPAGQQRR